MTPTPEKVGLIATLGGFVAFWTGLLKVFLVFMAIGFGISFPVTLCYLYAQKKKVRDLETFLNEK